MIAQIYTVKSLMGQDDMRPRPELGETQVRHADMLRYDLAFHNPDNPNEVIFPVFKGPYGLSSRTITTARWHSFSMILQANLAKNRYIENYGDWITYRHPDGKHFDLVPQTLREYLESQKRTKLAERHR
jgi:hypothetical protein